MLRTNKRPTSFKTALPAFAAFAITLAGTTVPAHALEGKALFEKLFKEGTQITYDSIAETGGGSFSATGVKISYSSGRRSSSIKALDVIGLKETSDGRLTLEKISATELSGQGSKSDSPYTIGGLVLENSEIPYKIWEGGLTAEEKKQRMTIGALSMTSMSVQQNNGDKVDIDSATLQNADFPLDWRFDPVSSADTSDIAEPMTFDIFAIAGISGATSQGVTWDVASMTVNGAKVPTSFAAAAHAWMGVYKSINVGKISATLAGIEVFSMESLNGTIGAPDNEGTIPSFSEVKKINVNLKAIPDPQAQAVVQQLGYETLELDMVGDGKYNPKSGALSIDNFAMNFKDMANLNMTYGMEGYTTEVASALQQAQIKVAGGSNPQTAYAELLPILSNLKLSNFKLGLTDKSLTGRLLDYQAGQMGTTGDQLAQGAPLMIGLGLGGLNMPEFTEMVTKAVGSFLQNVFRN